MQRQWVVCEVVSLLSLEACKQIPFSWGPCQEATEGFSIVWDGPEQWKKLGRDRNGIPESNWQAHTHPFPTLQGPSYIHDDVMFFRHQYILRLT